MIHESQLLHYLCDLLFDLKFPVCKVRILNALSKGIYDSSDVFYSNRHIQLMYQSRHNNM